MLQDPFSWSRALPGGANVGRPGSISTCVGLLFWWGRRALNLSPKKNPGAQRTASNASPSSAGSRPANKRGWQPGNPVTPVLVAGGGSFLAPMGLCSPLQPLQMPPCPTVPQPPRAQAGRGAHGGEEGAPRESEGNATLTSQQRLQLPAARGEQSGAREDPRRRLLGPSKTLERTGRQKEHTGELGN